MSHCCQSKWEKVHQVSSCASWFGNQYLDHSPNSLRESNFSFGDDGFGKSFSTKNTVLVGNFTQFPPPPGLSVNMTCYKSHAAKIIKSRTVVWQQKHRLFSHHGDTRRCSPVLQFCLVFGDSGGPASYLPHLFLQLQLSGRREGTTGTQTTSSARESAPTGFQEILLHISEGEEGFL